MSKIFHSFRQKTIRFVKHSPNGDWRAGTEIITDETTADRYIRLGLAVEISEKNSQQATVSNPLERSEKMSLCKQEPQTD